MGRAWFTVATITLIIVASVFSIAQKPASTSATAKKQQPAAKPKQALSLRDQREIVFNILEEVHEAAEELPTAQKLPILRELCGNASYQANVMERADWLRPKGLEGESAAATDLEPQSAKRLMNWAEELYAAADELPQGSYAKLSTQSTAIRAMVPVDANRALQMMDALEASDVKGAEREQNHLAVFVFSELLRLQGEKIVPELRLRTQSMGSKGQYPYSAMAVVSMGLSNREQVRAIFNDALTSFENSDDNLNSMTGMLTLARNEKIRASLEPWQVHEAAVAIANRLKAEIDTERRAYQQGQAMRPGLSIIARGVQEGLKDVDPEQAASIPELPPYTPVGAKQTVGDGAPPPAPESPEVKKLRSDFGKTSIRLMIMSESEIHSGAELRQVIEKGLDHGVELLRASVVDAKDHVAALETAMPPLTDFVQVASRTNPSMALAAVRKVQDSEIRARMLITIAVGLPQASMRD